MKILHTTDNGKVIEFLKKNHANKEQVELTGATIWSVAVEDNRVVGVSGVNLGKYADRVKGFFVVNDMRKNGVGAALLQDALKQTRAPRVTAFCTRNSENLFLKQGFIVTRKANKYGISFVEWRRES